MASAAAGSSAAGFAFSAGVHERLAGWFRKYGASTVYEVECRIRDVTEAGFERVLQSLLSNKSWTNTPMPEVTIDQIHATGVRETRKVVAGPPAPSAFMRKQQGDEFIVGTPAGFDVKFQVSSERESSADASPVHCWRHKQRIEFVHKNTFRFDLTKVKQGSNDQAARAAETQFEVEIEFCGQSAEAASRPEYLADSMLMKAADLLRQLAAPGTGPPTGAKRARADGSLQECEEVMLRPGTEVALAPSGQGAPPPFGGEMPAELATRTPWVFSHLEPGGDAHIMSLPSAIGDNRYPLYYFAGTVPVAALIRRPGAG